MTELGDLIARSRTGDLDAYGEVVRATQAMAHGVARGVLRDPALAEDAVQEACRYGLFRLPSLHPRRREFRIREPLDRVDQ
jgi:DNA-directed RNA polymerase specialized sigma24 family protein